MRHVRGGERNQRLGDLDGTAQNADNELAFVAPFGVAAMDDATNQAWLDALWKEVVSRSIASDDYYANAIKMLTMLTMSGNYWAP